MPKQSNRPSDKKLIKEIYQEKLAAFKLNPGRVGNTIELTVPSKIPFETHKNRKELWTLTKRVPFDNGSYIDFFACNMEPHSFVVHTKGERIGNYLKRGLLNTSSAPLTAKVVNALGKYHQNVIERIRNNVVSTRFNFKRKHLDTLQDLLLSLGKLEEFINPVIDLRQNAERCVDVLRTLQKIVDYGRENFLAAAQAKRDDVLIVGLDKLKNELEEFQAKLNGILIQDVVDPNQVEKKLVRLFKSTGTHSLFTFMKQQMLFVLNLYRTLDQDNAYCKTGGQADEDFMSLDDEPAPKAEEKAEKEKRHAVVRGDLRSAIVEAVHVIQRFEVKHKDPYGFMAECLANPQANFCLDSSCHLNKEVEIETLFAAISLCEGQISLNCDNDKVKLVGNAISDEHGYGAHHDVALKESASPKWAMGGSVKVKAKKAVAFLGNAVGGTIAGVAWDSWRGAWKGFRNQPYTPAAYDLNRWLAKWAKNPESRDEVFGDLAQYMQKAPPTIGPRALSMASHFVESIGGGIKDALLGFGHDCVDQALKVSVDWSKPLAEAELYSQLDKSCQDIKNAKAERKKELTEQFFTQQAKVPQATKNQPAVAIDSGGEQKQQLAEPLLGDAKPRRSSSSIALPRGSYGAVDESRGPDMPVDPKNPPRFVNLGSEDVNEWNDLFSVAGNGAEKFIDLWGLNINAKHPLTGLIYTSFYAAGGLALITPEVVMKALSPFIGSANAGEYIEFSKLVGNAMAGGKMGAGIAGGFLQAKVAAATFEAMLHGPKSWLAKGLDDFANDPAKAVLFTAVATGVGYALAYKIPVPWLSEHLRDDYGTFWPAAGSFAGLKLFVVLKEVLETHGTEAHAAALKKLEAYLIDAYLYEKKKKVAKQVQPHHDIDLEHDLHHQNGDYPAAQDDFQAEQKQPHDLHQLSRDEMREVFEAVVKLTSPELNFLSELDKILHPISQEEEALFTPPRAPSFDGAHQPVIVIADEKAETPNEKQALALRRLYLVLKLQEHRAYLPYLDAKLKAQMMQYIKQFFKADEVQALGLLFYPASKKSILGHTVRLSLAYIPGLMRALAGLRHPINDFTKGGGVNDLGRKALKDITRMFYTLKKVTKTLKAMPMTFFIRPLADVIANETIARVQGMFSDKHSASEFFNNRMTEMDLFYEKYGRQSFINEYGLDDLEEAVSIPNPDTVMEKVMIESSQSVASSYASIIGKVAGKPPLPAAAAAHRDSLTSMTSVNLNSPMRTGVGTPARKRSSVLSTAQGDLPTHTRTGRRSTMKETNAAVAAAAIAAYQAPDELQVADQAQYPTPTQQL